MIKNNHLNALNLFEMRRFEVPPAHFEHICIPLKYNLEESLNSLQKIVKLKIDEIDKIKNNII